MDGYQTSRLVLPTGIEPDGLPPAVHIDEDGFVASTTYRCEGGILVAEMHIERPARLLDRDTYTRWREAHQKADAAIRVPVILRASSAKPSP